MIEWSSPADCYVKGLGECMILQNTLGCYSCNPQFLVLILSTGELRTCDQNSVALYGNPSTGLPLESDLIKKWKLEDESKKQAS
jgi:hypothetical protein